MSALRSGHSVAPLAAQASSAMKPRVYRMLPVRSRGSSGAAAGASPRFASRRLRMTGSIRVKTTSASSNSTEGRSSQTKS